jgi:hypothetical protein
LSTAIPSETDDSNPSSEPSPKRAKVNGAAPTITNRVESEAYASLGALVEDVNAVIDDLLTTIKTKEIELPQTQYGRPSSLTADESRLWVGTTKFKKLLGDLVAAEKERQKLVKGGKRLLNRADSEKDAKADTPIKEEEDAVLDDEGKPVLTLYANAPAPKQLFSSFQAAGKQDGATPPLREAGLPSFISTTKITPLPIDDLKKSKKAPTFGDLYGSTSEKYKLQPPKPAKTKLVTTGNSVEFVRVDGPIRPTRRNSYNYFTDKLAVGQWLTYGGTDTPQEPTSPQAKRKQRDRALSTGEAFLAPSEGEKEALRRARNDALFRKCYSSFAPSYDDSTAIVPKDVRNEIWMDKVGERLARKDIVIDPALLDPPAEPTPEEQKMEMNELKEFVDTFDPALLEWDAEQTKAEKEMEDVLQEVSELLETLSSFQRIRNSSLSTSSRTTVGQNNPVTDLMGTPTTPSSAEAEVYKTLKLQLAVLVNQLPPYAVARLNGDQLEELNIKTSIVVETEDAQGVMAEDEATRAAKMQAYAAATGSQAQAGRTPATNSYANYPASASQYNRTPAPQQQLRPSNYYTPQAQSQQRPAPVTYNRSSSNLQNYTTNYAQNANRTSYQQNYNQTPAAPRTNFQQPQNAQYFSQMQNSTTSKTGYNQSYQQPGTPQQQRPTYPQNTPASTYQPRPSNTAPMYGGYAPAASPQARTQSPQVPPQTQTQYSQPRQSQGYSTPAPSSQNPSYYRPPTAGGGQQQYQNSFQQQPTMRGPPSASLTPSRQGSGTPQPPQQNYGQTNGTGAPAMVGQQSS